MPGPEIFGDGNDTEGPSFVDGVGQTHAPADAENAGSADVDSSGTSDTKEAQAERAETEHAENNAVTDDAGEAVPETEETEGEI